MLFERVLTSIGLQRSNDMISVLLLAVGRAHPSRGNQGGDWHMKSERHMSVCAVCEPDAGMQRDNLGSSHQDDVHNDGQGLVLSR